MQEINQRVSTGQTQVAAATNPSAIGTAPDSTDDDSAI